ncbi:MAG TPA: hypothetical protein VLR88_06980 [Propionibacteriaceae bacterium]|nr:hypothetical protein [Propionibacteriaceae bacterium]
MVAVAAVAIYSRVNPLWGEWTGSELAPWSGSPAAPEGVTLAFSIGGTLQGVGRLRSVHRRLLDQERRAHGD